MMVEMRASRITTLTPPPIYKYAEGGRRLSYEIENFDRI
jgi:hypothetical protein